jgi:nicotinamide riboside kinase
MLAKRIAVIGAESTGKTQLCQNLADRLQGIALAEALREFTARCGRPPYRSEQDELFAKQVRDEQNALTLAVGSAIEWVLCDSAPLMTAVYSLYYFDDDRLLEPALEYHSGYAATLLCATDIPWQSDPGQRDGPQVRQAVQDLLQSVILGRLTTPTFEVSGDGEHRSLGAYHFLLALPRA